VQPEPIQTITHTKGIVDLKTNFDLIFGVSKDSTVNIWDAHSGKLISSLKSEAENLRCVGYDPTGDRNVFATGAQDGLIQVGFHLRLIVQKARLLTFSFNLQLWDSRAQKSIASNRDHKQAVLCLSMLKNRLVSGSRDCTLRLWDTAGLKPINTMRGVASPITSAQFDDDQVICGTKAGIVKIWSLQGQNELHGHAKGILGLQVCICYYLIFTP
jgi:F-box and WD-40 domain protein 1/11